MEGLDRKSVRWLRLRKQKLAYEARVAARGGEEQRAKDVKAYQTALHEVVKTVLTVCEPDAVHAIAEACNLRVTNPHQVAAEFASQLELQKRHHETVTPKNHPQKEEEKQE